MNLCVFLLAIFCHLVLFLLFDASDILSHPTMLGWQSMLITLSPFGLLFFSAHLAKNKVCAKILIGASILLFIAHIIIYGTDMIGRSYKSISFALSFSFFLTLWEIYPVAIFCAIILMASFLTQYRNENRG